MLVYIDDRDDEELSENESDISDYGYDYGSQEDYDNEKYSYDYEENSDCYFD